MDWPKFLLVMLAIVGIGLCNESVAFAASASCQSQNAVFSGCTGAQNSNNSVDVWARSTTPGGSSSVVVPAGRSSGGTRSTKPTPYYATGTIAFNCLARQSTIASCRRTPAPPAPAPVNYAPVTLTDLANFVPQSASLTSQPRGWTVVNLNTNFIAGASTHVVGGSLFGQSAEVRFTPHAYDWNYGDGGTQSTAVSGARWDALGLREFSATPTSHIYASEGSFTTSVSVRYGVEYRVGGGAWIPVSGEVSSSATTTVVIVEGADTVLAARDCTNSRNSQSCN
ncbi:hypothetical protein M2114_001110 [Aurantimicrobium minutum]|nr:hypothetical protein [Aurantimicrobium minutum]MDH6424993.1 hypothetical protein [Aurantimicrobium minutum]